MSIIKIQNLSFEYALADKKSLDGINLEIGGGDFIIIFGSSGSGKTTLLRHMKHELAPAGRKSGQVYYNGRNITELDSRTAACEIGFVMQDPENQIVTDEVWHELAFGMENLGENTQTIRRRVAEMASFFGIGSWFHKKTSELSGGQKQLLNLASVIVMRPKLLLLDEPAAQLDPVAAREFIGMVSRLNRELGITIVMTGHNLEEILPLAGRVVRMENGRIIYETTARGLPDVIRENGDAFALRSLPAAARIFSGMTQPGTCPLTVREGRRRILSFYSQIRHDENDENDALPAVHGSEIKRQAAVRCSNIYFRYGKNSPDVLNGLNFSAFYGEIAFLMGENGCGKSTLLKLITGLIKPQIGKISINGKNINTYSENGLYYGNIGFLPQNPKSVFLHDTLKEELSDMRIVEKLGLCGLLERHPYDLSGGEQQKAAFARVLEQKPRIFLMDEPTKGLDAKAKGDFAEILLKLKEKGACIIICTHDMEFAADYATRCVLLFDGESASEGGAREFFSGNSFYTTAANRIARDICPLAVTCEDVINCLNPKK